MTNKELDKFKTDLDIEIDNYRKIVLEGTKQSIYDSCYEINAYEMLHDHLCEMSQDYNRKYFPPNDILGDVYYRFMKTDYELNSDDISMFLKDYVDDNKKFRRFENCEEM